MRSTLRPAKTTTKHMKKRKKDTAKGRGLIIKKDRMQRTLPWVQYITIHSNYSLPGF